MQTTTTDLEFMPANPATIDQIQANLITYFRLFAGLPSINFIEEGCTWNVGGPGPHILRSQMTEDAIHDQIDHLFHQIGQLSDCVDWFVFPSCQPADLGERVAAYGLAGGPDGAWMLYGKSGGPGGNWMLTDLTALADPPAVAENFHIKYVDSNAMLAQWLQLSRAGFGQEEPIPLSKIAENYFYAGYARHGFGRDAYSLHYIGYLDDEPVTAATILLANGIAGLFDISTPPAFRRQGFGSAISWYMLYEAQQRGYALAYVWSSEMGKGVYQGVGFIPAAIGMREYQWKKRDG